MTIKKKDIRYMVMPSRRLKHEGKIDLDVVQFDNNQSSICTYHLSPDEAISLGEELIVKGEILKKKKNE